MVQDALRERAGADTYAGVRLAAVEILIGGPDAGSATVTALVDRAERDSDPAVFRAAVTGLIERFDWRPSAVETLRRHADSPNSLIRLPAIELLGTYFGADTAVRARLIACARTDGDIHVRRAAVDVLGRELARHAPVRKLLRDLVSDPDWSLRCAAVRFLGRCAGADADVRALFIDLATNDPNPDFRRIIGQTLTWLPDADPDLLPAIADITV
jgi:HEAT repeat protein